MNKILITFFTVLFYLNSYVVLGKDIVGEMKCVVKNQNIIIMNDGVSKEYKGFTNSKTIKSLNVGDTFKIKFNVNEYEVSIVSQPDSKTLPLLMFSNFYPPSSKFVKKDNSTKVTQSDGRMSSVMDISNNHIRLSGKHKDLVIIGGTVLKRYYKSDWMGITTSLLEPNEDIESHSISYNCKSITGNTLEDFSEEIKNFVNNKK